MIAPVQSLLSLKVDWRAYYRLFCQLHGGRPVNYKGIQLFRDGWTYGLKDYDGPEWAPPQEEEERKALIQAYWAVRKVQVERLLLTLRLRVEGLKNLQAAKSAPVQVAHYTWDDDKNTKVRQVRDLDLTLFDGQLAELEADLKECESQLLLLETQKGWSPGLS